MTIVIGIAGGSGAGKTTLARSVYEELGQSENVAYLVHDNYYKHQPHLTFEERSKLNFDHPESLDTDLLVHHIQELKAGRTVQVPTYDFTTHLRKTAEGENDNSHEITMEPKPIILVEGILIFAHEPLVKELDVKVYVDADSDIRLLRRINRDTVERGRSASQVIEQYQETVRPMHEEFVEPSKRVADIIVHSHKGNNGDSDDDGANVALKMITNHLKCEGGF